MTRAPTTETTAAIIVVFDFFEAVSLEAELVGKAVDAEAEGFPSSYLRIG